ncbi:unnamed protein product, partial [Rotaria sp. Silwood1]
IQEEIDLDVDEMKRHNHINESFATDPEFGRQNIRTKRELGHRDLWYDKLYGNSLKVDAHGNILTVVYGFKFLNKHAVREFYPNNYVISDDRIYVYYTLFNLSKIYLIACLMDYFSIVATYVEDRTAIEFGENILSSRAIFKDVRNTRSHDAKTFLLIDSEYWYTDKLMTYLLATDSDTNNSKRDWKSHFNYIVVDAQKPLFFAEGTTLRRIDQNTGSMKLGSNAVQLQQNEVYSGVFFCAIPQLVYDEKLQSNSTVRHHSTLYQTFKNTRCFDRSISAFPSIHTHPDLPLYIIHDHDEDGDPDDDNPSKVGHDLDFDVRSNITYTSPKKTCRINK